MAGAYKATLEVKCWKEHTCCYCGAAYRYLLRKSATGHGPSQTDAASAARTAAVRGLRSALGLRPCPGCGKYQPDMIGALRLSRHAVLFLVTLGVVVGLFLLGVLEWVPASVTLYFLVAFTFVSLLLNTWIGARNPNSKLRANKALAERLVAEQRLQIVTSSAQPEEKPRAVVIETGVAYWLAFLLLGATVLLLPGAELARLAGRWEWNSGWHPGIIGPGDTAWTWVHVPLDKPLESLGGEWRATGSGKILNPPNIKQEKLDLPRVTSRDLPWSTSVANGTGQIAPVRLWARVEFPTEGQLANQRVRIELKLKVVTPEANPNKPGVIDRTHEVPPFTTEVRLSSRGAGRLYGVYWYVAHLGGGLMLLLAGSYHMLRDYALKQCGLPTRVVAVGDDENAAPAAPAEPLKPQPQPEEKAAPS